MHAEAGKGRFEIALGYSTCGNAADNLVFTREVVRSVARKHGLLATFVPKYALYGIGSVSHVHIRLSENGENVFMAGGESSEHGMYRIGEEFMAGVLDHLPSILVFTAPVPDSFDRIQPNTWSGAYPTKLECWCRVLCKGFNFGLLDSNHSKTACANIYIYVKCILLIVKNGIDIKFLLFLFLAFEYNSKVSKLNGFVMGGGAGISIHGKFRVATENMPLASAYGLAKHIDGRWEWAIAPGVSPSPRRSYQTPH